MSCFLHADLDAFYASVEQLDNPEYRGKPVIVGGLPGDRRSVVSTASYEARKFGVHSAMSIAEAARRCPGGVFLRCRMKRYQEKSAQVMAVFADFSPEVQRISVDEAFLDISGTEKLFGPPETAARKLKEAVRERTALTVSIGAASNKYLAKIASGLSKPDGLTVVAPGGEEAFMRSLPVSRIWGAGEKTQEVFKRYGFKTCGDLAQLERNTLVSIFGVSFGTFLYRAVRGQAAESFSPGRSGHSISAERTFEYDLFEQSALDGALLDICQDLNARLLRHGLLPRTVTVKIRYSDFTTESVRETASRAALTLDDLYRKSLALFGRKYKRGRGVRLLGVALSGLESEACRQGELFPEEANEKARRLEKAVLEINTRFPSATVRRAAAGLPR